MNLLKYSKIYLSVWVLVILLSVVFLGTRGLNYGVDFTGGTNIRFPLRKPVTSLEVMEALETPSLAELDLRPAPPQPYNYMDSTGRQRYGVLVQTRFLTPQEQEQVVGTLEEIFGPAGDDAGVEIYGVDPLIGREMLSKTLYAVLIAGALILGYMAFRFEFKSGVAGLLALVFDVMSVIGIFSLLRREVNVTFVAALLTILGYSINNTIVVFDRIRENLRFRQKGEAFAETVNLSILQTMRRCLNTSITTVISVLILYLVGSPSIREFCLALIIGFTVGTYTSLFIASSFWVFFERLAEKNKRRRAVARAG